VKISRLCKIPKYYTDITVDVVDEQRTCARDVVVRKLFVNLPMFDLKFLDDTELFAARDF